MSPGLFYKWYNYLTNLIDRTIHYRYNTVYRISEGENIVLFGVSFIICATLSSVPRLVQIVQGTIAAAAVINEFIAVIAAKKGFELAGEIEKTKEKRNVEKAG